MTFACVIASSGEEAIEREEQRTAQLLADERYEGYAYTYPEKEPALRKRLIAYFESHNARLYAYLDLNFAWDA